MMKESPRLGTLPVEILRQIASSCTSPSVFALLRVSRRVYDACNDWTVWRGLIERKLHFATKGLRSAISNSAWKQYAIADLKAYEGQICDDMIRWAPSLMALHHPMLTSANASELYTRSSPQKSLPTLELDDWNSAQAFSFCLTVRLLSHTITAGDGENGTDPWGLQRPLTHTGPEIRDDSFSNIPKMHTFANKTVGFFGIDMRKRISAYLAICGDAANVLYPPAAQDIPFASFMKLPEPFATPYIESFNSCHLPAMTDQDFLVDEEWTGYFGPPFPYLPGDVELTGGMLFDPHDGHFGGGTVRFHVVRFDPSTIVLRSNCFQTWSRNIILGLTIDKNTGIITTDKYNSAGAIIGSHLGVITPFGIVASRPYMWLWKTSWTPCWESLSGEPPNLHPGLRDYRHN